MADVPTDQAGLAAMVDGKSDEEIAAGVHEMGTETVLAAIFGAFKDRFQADKAAGQAAVIQWDVKDGDDTHIYQLKVADGNLDVVPGGSDPAKVTLTLALPDFIKFIGGKLDGMQAFMTGKLKLGGDMMFAQTMQSWFAQ